jgi:hypothetical protein
MERMKYAAVIFLVVLVSFYSCKKDKPFSPRERVRPPYPIVSSDTFTNLTNTFITHYVYDTLGWIILSEEGDNYVYTQNTVADLHGFVYTLDSRGLATTWAAPSPPGGEVYTYDNNGYLIKVSAGAGFDMDSFEYNADSNMVRGYGYSPNSGYTIYLNDFYGAANTLGNRNFGKAFLGKSSRNLIKKTTSYYIYQGDTSLHITDYAYTYNDSGWAVSQTTTNGSGSFTRRYAYW